MLPGLDIPRGGADPCRSVMNSSRRRRILTNVPIVVTSIAVCLDIFPHPNPFKLELTREFFADTTVFHKADVDGGVITTNISSTS
jgi:hypothetical protein